MPSCRIRPNQKESRRKSGIIYGGISGQATYQSVAHGKGYYPLLSSTLVYKCSGDSGDPAWVGSNLCKNTSASISNSSHCPHVHHASISREISNMSFMKPLFTCPAFFCYCEQEWQIVQLDS